MNYNVTKIEDMISMLRIMLEGIEKNAPISENCMIDNTGVPESMTNVELLIKVNSVLNSIFMAKNK